MVLPLLPFARDFPVKIHESGNLRCTTRLSAQII